MRGFITEKAICCGEIRYLKKCIYNFILYLRSLPDVINKLKLKVGITAIKSVISGNKNAIITYEWEWYGILEYIMLIYIWTNVHFLGSEGTFKVYMNV